MISFTYLEPTSMDEALDLLARYGEEAKLIAGGTGLVNLMKQRLVQPMYLIGLRQIPGLGAVRHDGDLRLGALCTHRTIETSALVRTHVPLLADTFQQVASVRIRTVATIGGALAHADPNQDPPPTLLVLDARVCLRSQQRERDVAVSDFFTGYYETVMEPDELLTTIVIPSQPAGSGTAFLKFLPQTHDVPVHGFGTGRAVQAILLESPSGQKRGSHCRTARPDCSASGAIGGAGGA
ncbi:MAG: hypothetical protein EXR78_07395, partial [Deltaproteobacteria bacterium]|nr:hypothetical protein [Deltaproteobacteria bacterium]